jgi:hypothetical protein
MLSKSYNTYKNICDPAHLLLLVKNKFPNNQCFGSSLVLDPGPTFYLNATFLPKKMDFDTKIALYVIKHTYVGTKAILKGWK